MISKPEIDFLRGNEVEYLYGVQRKELMVKIFAALSEAKEGFPQNDKEWERERAKYRDYNSLGLLHEISCLLKSLDDKDKEALKKLVALAKSGLELRRNLTLPGHKIASQSYEFKACFEALPHMLGHSTKRIAEKLDDFELNWLRTLVFLAGGKAIDERKAELIEALRR